jgi:hypothetical protein
MQADQPIRELKAGSPPHFGDNQPGGDPELSRVRFSRADEGMRILAIAERHYPDRKLGIPAHLPVIFPRQTKKPTLERMEASPEKPLERVVVRGNHLEDVVTS